MNIRKTIITTAVALTTVAMIAPMSAGAITVAELQAQINALLAQLQQLQGTQTTSGTMPAACVGVTFSRNLVVGSTGSDVKCLQAVMNALGHTVATSGAGSPGNETTTFGPKTLAAVRAYQVSQGWTPANQVGPMTRANLNAWLGGGTTGLPPAPPSTSGNVSVSLGSNTPGDTTVPTGANGVRVFDFVVTASSNADAIVTSVKIKRTGVGTTSEISNAYLYDGAMRLTSGRTFNSSTNDATFSMNLTVPKGTSKTISLRVNTTGSTAGSHVFSISASTDLSLSGGSVMGSFPIMSKMMTLSSVSAGTLTVEKNGSLSNPRVGDMGVKVAEFKLSAGTEDAWVNQVTLTQGGNIANSAITNFMLKQGGTTVATASSIDSKGRLNLVFAPAFRIERGNNRVFELYADVMGRPADTIALYMEETADAVATGGTYNAGMGVTLNANFDQAADTGITLTLQGGNFVITFTGPSSRNISNTSNDVALWEGTLYTVNSIEVRNWRVRIQDTTAGDPDLCDSSSSCMIQDIKIWNLGTNSVIAGPKELTAGANNQSEILVMADTVTLPAGSTTRIRVTADVRNTPASSTMVLLTTLNAFGTTDLKNIDSNTFLTPSTDVSPNSNIPGNNQTVTAGALAIATSSSPTDMTIVKGVADKEVTAFDFVVGSGDSVRVNSIAVTAGASDTDDNAYGAAGAADGSSTSVSGVVLSAKLMDGATQIGTSKSFSSGVATFDNLNWVIAASQTKKLSVVISTNSAATLNATSDFLRISLEASSVTAVDSQGNTVSATGLAANSAEAAGDVVITISDSGTLTATLAPQPTNPASALMYGGSTGKVFAAFKFSAVNDSFLVKKFQLLPYVGAANSAASNDRISGLYVRYRNQAGTTVTQAIGLSGTSTNVDISANPMYVGVNSDATLEVLGDLALFTIQDGTEDENVTFALKGTDATNNQATGIGSNSDVSGGVFSATDLAGNAQYVYRTNLAVASHANTPVGQLRSRAAGQNVASYAFTSTSSANNSSSYFRGSKKAADSATTGWVGTGVGASATSTTAVSGSSSISHTEDGTSAAHDHFDYDFGASAGLNNYNRMSFWIRSSVAKAAAGDMVVHWSTDVDATDNGALNITSQGNSNVPALTAATWTFVDVALTGVTSATRYVTFNIAANPDNSSVILVDDLRFYNDNFTATASGNFGAAATINGLLFSAKNSGGTTVAYGGYTGTGGGAGSTGTVTLIPGDGADVATTTTYSAVEVGSSQVVLDVQTNTNTLIATDTTANENLSVTITTGTPSSAGNFRWYDNSDAAGSNNLAGITVINPISTTIDYSNNY